MPYRVVEERCGRWWHYWWAGPVTYIHLVDLGDLGEDVSPEFCEYALPGRLVYMHKYSIPVACLPLVYRESETAWVFQGKSYTRLDSLIAALERAVETWPHWCSWAPRGPLPPGILDTGLLQEALLKMPILRPKPEDLAVDFVVWTYEKDVTAFLHSEYIHLTASTRFEERWREICEHEDPRQCYPGAVGEWLVSVKAQGKVPAVDSALFGRRYARPWGTTPVYYRTERGATRIYYVLGRLLREALPRIQMLKEQSEWEIPRLVFDDVLDIQGPIMRRIRKRRPEPLAPIEPVEDFLPPARDVKGGPLGGPLAAFDLLDL